MEKLSEGNNDRIYSRKKRLFIKSLPLVSVLLDGNLTVDEVRDGQYVNAIVGTVMAAGIGIAGSHIILNNGPKFKETWQDIRNWGNEKVKLPKSLFPSRRRTLIAGTLATMGLIMGGDGAVQTVQGNFGEAAQAATTGVLLEGLAGLNLNKFSSKKGEDATFTIIEPAYPLQTIETSTNDLNFPPSSGLEEGPMTELQESQTSYLAGPEVNL